MANLSQQKRERMLAFLETLKTKNADDDDTLRAIGEIENELNSKKYGLVWEKHEEAVDVKMKDYIPVFTEDHEREITISIHRTISVAILCTMTATLKRRMHLSIQNGFHLCRIGLQLLKRY